VIVSHTSTSHKWMTNDGQPFHTSTSLRWYDPDQVLRVSKAHFDLSLSKGTPSGINERIQL
jgi:hypothetical protein